VLRGFGLVEQRQTGPRKSLPVTMLRHGFGSNLADSGASLDDPLLWLDATWPAYGT
jgi:hypothetical protein